MPLILHSAPHFRNNSTCMPEMLKALSPDAGEYARASGLRGRRLATGAGQSTTKWNCPWALFRGDMGC